MNHCESSQSQAHELNFLVEEYAGNKGKFQFDVSTTPKN